MTVVVAIVFWLVLGLTVPGYAEVVKQKVALVIGNSNYAHVPTLRNPINDAGDIAAALKRLGFSVTLGLDYDDQQMRQALRNFSRAADASALSLVYFAGHGIEIDKTNYLIPINAELQGDQDAQFEAIPLDLVMQSLARAPGVKLVLVDACRNNPFAARLIAEGTSRSIGQGLVRVDPIGGVLPGGVMIGYAAREGTVALDGVGRNSPYAQGLLEFLEEPGLEISKLFRKVRDRVFELTMGQQEPFTYGSLPGADIYLVPPEHPNGQLAAVGPFSFSVAPLMENFAEAETIDTLEVWREFTENYGENNENALVALAIERRDALQNREDRRKQALKNEPWLIPAAGLRPSGPIQLTLEERKLIQKALMYMGFDPGKPDGQFGPNTLRAISAARLAAGLFPGSHVDAALIRALPNVRATDALQSVLARKYDHSQLASDIEPRLRKALQNFSEAELKFAYFEGRLYLAVLAQQHLDWHLASKKAQSLGGHLATIASEEENRFIFEMFSTDVRFIRKNFGESFSGPVFGLLQVHRNQEPDGGWAWVTGEPLAYSNWSRGNPNNRRLSQHFGGFHGSSGDQNPYSGPIKWNDTNGNGSAFIIEIE